MSRRHTRVMIKALPLAAARLAMSLGSLHNYPQLVMMTGLLCMVPGCG
jgi:hypothetical protein